MVQDIYVEQINCTENKNTAPRASSNGFQNMSSRLQHDRT